MDDRKSKLVTIFSPTGGGLLVHKTIANQFGLQDWQRIDQKTFDKVFAENATYTLLLINQQLGGFGN